MKAFIIHDIAASEIVHVFVGDDRAVSSKQIKALGARLRRVECELLVLPAEPITSMEAVIYVKAERVHEAVAAIEAKRQ